MSRLSRRWSALTPEDRSAFGALAGLLLAGAALRAVVMFTAAPALLGYPDSYFYIRAAHHQLFSDPGHTAGYAVFLRVLHGIDPHLLVVVLVQHLLGVVTGVLLFLTVRRAGVRGWPAVLPAAVILLGGPVVLLEQAPMSETLFAALQAGMLYAAVRPLDGHPLAWGAGAGALAGLAALVRPVALISLPFLAAWLLIATHGHGRGLRRAAPAGIATLVAALLLVGYVVVQDGQTGRPGLVQASGWYLYARAAPFAECGEFDPPPGTAHLCQRSEPSRRPGPNDYIFDAKSPAVKAYGSPYTASASANAELASFGRAVVLHQPLDWLEQVATEELPRFVLSGRQVREDQGMGYGALATTLATPPTKEMAVEAGASYRDADGSSGRHDLDPLRSYERWARLDGPLAALAILLAVAGLALARGRQRAVALLLVGVGVGGMLGSALSLFYDARYAIAAWGPLAAAAAIGVAALRPRLATARLPWR